MRFAIAGGKDVVEPTYMSHDLKTNGRFFDLVFGKNTVDDLLWVVVPR